MKAAIDIGSNTVLLLIGEYEAGTVQTVYEAQHAPRMGQGVDAAGNLNEESIQRVLEVLYEYKSILEQDYPSVTDTIVLATSAVRDAKNRKDFIELVEKETGFGIQILSGFEEAQYTYTGAKSVLPNSSYPSAVVDIGGGSTEIAVGEGSKMIDRFSFDMGSVRFTERYLKKSPPAQIQLDNCRMAIAEMLKHYPIHWDKEMSLIGVAGTVTSLAAIKLNIHSYKPDLLNGAIISKAYLSSAISKFSEMTPDQLLKKYPDILKGRADIILAGLLILEGVMNEYMIANLKASTGGIRHGAIMLKK